MKCAFCDGESVTHGGEHLWDDWINSEIPKKLYHAKKRLTLTSTPIQFATKGLKEKVPAVCTKCNNGWMSALTAKIKGRYSATVLNGAPFSLGPEDAVILAAFTLMKAVAKNYYYGRDDPFFTRAACERLRNSLAIPHFVKMWAAAYQGASRYAFHSNFHIVSTSEPGPLYGMEFFSYTYILGNLVLQLLAPRRKDILDRGKPLITLVPNARWQSTAIQFWPEAGQALSWPPAKYFGDSTIEHFIYRFGVPVTVRL